MYINEKRAIERKSCYAQHIFFDLDDLFFSQDHHHDKNNTSMLIHSITMLCDKIKLFLANKLFISVPRKNINNFGFPIKNPKQPFIE